MSAWQILEMLSPRVIYEYIVRYSFKLTTIPISTCFIDVLYCWFSIFLKRRTYVCYLATCVQSLYSRVVYEWRFFPSHFLSELVILLFLYDFSKLQNNKCVYIVRVCLCRFTITEILYVRLKKEYLFEVVWNCRQTNRESTGERMECRSFHKQLWSVVKRSILISSTKIPQPCQARAPTLGDTCVQITGNK